MALAARLDNKKYRVYCLTSDGEHDEGNHWEAVLFAGKQKSKLNNLTAVVDRNNIQIDGFTEDIMPLEPLRDKYESFGWRVIECDGHNIYDFVAAVNEARAVYEKPSVIIAHGFPEKALILWKMIICGTESRPLRKRRKSAGGTQDARRKDKSSMNKIFSNNIGNLCRHRSSLAPAASVPTPPQPDSLPARPSSASP